MRSWLASRRFFRSPNCCCSQIRNFLSRGIIFAEVVLHVIIDEGIADHSGKLRIARGEAQIENIGVSKPFRRQTAFKDPDQSVPVSNVG